MPELSVPQGIVTAEAALAIAGQPNAELSSALQSVVISETTEGLAHCEARFGNWGQHNGAVDFRYFDRKVLDFGKEITVRLGVAEGAGELFAGRISALEGQFALQEPPALVVLAEDRLLDLRLSRRSRLFEELSDAAVIEQIAREHGLQAEVDLPGPTHRVLAQVNQSDLAFIRSRARTLDADLWLAGRVLHAQARQRRGSANNDYRLVFQRGLLEFSVTADLANQYTSVVVSGWDVAAKAQLQEEASASVLGSELGQDESGAAIQERAFGKRLDRLTHCQPQTSAEARALAEATFRAQARRFVFGTGLARGDARLRVGAKVQLVGLGPLFSGAYIISETRHCFRRGPDGGYTTEFTAERVGLGRP